MQKPPGPRGKTVPGPSWKWSSSKACRNTCSPKKRETLGGKSLVPCLNNDNGTRSLLIEGPHLSPQRSRKLELKTNTQTGPLHGKQPVRQRRQGGEDLERQLPPFVSSEKPKAKAILLHTHMPTLIHATLGHEQLYCYIRSALAQLYKRKNKKL